jgi:hypothetical protein
MSADMQMAREAAEGETNLAVGEPYFLQQELLRSGSGFRFKWPMEYPRVGGEPELLDELKGFNSPVQAHRRHQRRQAGDRGGLLRLQDRGAA